MVDPVLGLEDVMPLSERFLVSLATFLETRVTPIAVKPPKVDADKAESAKVKSLGTELLGAESVRAESARAELLEAESVRAESVRTELVYPLEDQPSEFETAGILQSLARPIASPVTEVNPTALESKALGERTDALPVPLPQPSIP